MADGVVLVGLPGTGKTTVGRRVAQILGRPFIDLDEQIEVATGRSAADHIQKYGEDAFRALERDAVREACAVAGAVIAAGGGAPVDPLNRWAFMEHGMRVRLDAPVGVLAKRLQATAVQRPLLGERIAEGLTMTEAQRAPVYAAVDAVVHAGGDVDDVATAVVDAARATGTGVWRQLYVVRYARHHPMGPQEGLLRMGRGITPEALPIGSSVVFADERALAAKPSLAAALPQERLYAVPGGEQQKTMARLERLLRWLTEVGAERTDTLIVAGGGTVTDVGGLAAALHRRGMPLVNVPTTWLAQADSAIGGKVAIDLRNAKNAVGAFWPASLIVSDADLITSLPIERRRDGIAECLKAGLIGDPVLWALVEERGAAALAGEDPGAAYAITERAARVKLDVVDRDPFEEGERRVLNLGHTLGHALEIESGYTLAHGEAVALGLRAVAAIAAGRGAEKDQSERIDGVLTRLGFPLKRAFDPAAVRMALGTDKKRQAGTQRWILPMAVGHMVEVADVTEVELDRALATIAR